VAAVCAAALKNVAHKIRTATIPIIPLVIRMVVSPQISWLANYAKAAKV
jgi:hypothetical protein